MGVKMAVLTGMLLAVPGGAQTGAAGTTTAPAAVAPVGSGSSATEKQLAAVGGGSEEVVGLGGVRAV
jgi:hypothetical protein